MDYTIQDYRNLITFVAIQQDKVRTNINSLFEGIRFETKKYIRERMEEMEMSKEMTMYSLMDSAQDCWMDGLLDYVFVPWTAVLWGQPAEGAELELIHTNMYDKKSEAEKFIRSQQKKGIFEWELEPHGGWNPEDVKHGSHTEDLPF
jgi:hypothetical protein